LGQALITVCCLGPFYQLQAAIPLNLPHTIVQILEYVPEACPISSDVEILKFLVCFSKLLVAKLRLAQNTSHAFWNLPFGI